MFRRGRESQAQPALQRYQMREKLISFGDDYWIQNEAGQRVFHIDGKMLRIRQTLLFEDAQGNELLEIQERMMRLRESLAIERNGQKVAEVHSALVSPLRDRYKIDVVGGSDLEAQGNFLAHEYEIKQGNMKVAEVSKRWFRFADTYGVEIVPGQNDVLILAITVCIDAMSHPDK